MPRIYLISRPDECLALSDYLAELLRARYGAQNVVRATPARNATEYTQAIERDLRACHVVIVTMGPRWLTVADAAGQPWLTRPDDPVRIALATALRLGLLVAPVLSEGARMPAEAELPPDLRALPAIQAFPVRAGQYFAADMTRLYQQINTKLAWRPASVTVAALAILSALLLAAARIFGALARDTATAEAVNLLLILGMAAALLIATIVALTLAIRRRRGLWVWGIAGACALTLASFATPASIGTIWQSVLEFFMAVLLVFALIGPRRETAYA